MADNAAHIKRSRVLLNRYLDGEIDKPTYDRMLAELQATHPSASSAPDEIVERITSTPDDKPGAAPSPGHSSGSGARQKFRNQLDYARTVGTFPPDDCRKLDAVVYAIAQALREGLPDDEVLAELDAFCPRLREALTLAEETEPSKLLCRGQGLLKDPAELWPARLQRRPFSGGLLGCMHILLTCVVAFLLPVVLIGSFGG